MQAISRAVEVVRDRHPRKPHAIDPDPGRGRRKFIPDLQIPVTPGRARLLPSHHPPFALRVFPQLLHNHPPVNNTVPTSITPSPSANGATPYQPGPRPR